MTQPYPVTGVIDGMGIQPRLEIHDLLQKPIQFSLFIRALRKLQNMNSKEPHSPDYMDKPNSWWQLGAIHGMPYIPWSGDPKAPPKPDPQAKWQGYCYHGSALFPTWHRVSVLLVEQAVVEEAIAIATYLENHDPVAKKEKWLEAAKTLRFPYWDWTKPETAQIGIPQICQQEKIGIAIPGGKYSTVDNPLNHYQYAAKPGYVKDVEYMGDWDRTYRWANQDQNPTKEMYDKALQALSEGSTLSLAGDPLELQPVNVLRGKVASLFTYDLTLENPSYGSNMWAYFSNTQSKGVYSPAPFMPSSIEEPHNKIHLDCGGNGTMSMNEYAGFDPIFWLHHVNIDRLYAFWEYLYPDYWIENGWKRETGEIVPFITKGGNYYQDAGATVNHATSLEPFPAQSSAYWTSDDARSLLSTSPVQKYYTYPAIKDPRTGIEVKVDVPYDVKDLSLRKQFKQALLNEWGPDYPTVLQTHRDMSQAQAGQLSQHANILLKVDEELAHLRRFVVIGELREFAFPGSHRLELYIVPKNVQENAVVVNSVSVLARGDPDYCPGCRDRRAAGNHIRGYMHLDHRIVLYLLGRLTTIQRSEITTVEDVAVVIQGSLGMRVVKPDGTILAIADVDPSVGAGIGALEEAKAPKLTLHSHVVSFGSEDADVSVKFHDHTTHGEIGQKSGWKAF